MLCINSDRILRYLIGIHPKFIIFCPISTGVRHQLAIIIPELDTGKCEKSGAAHMAGALFTIRLDDDSRHDVAARKIIDHDCLHNRPDSALIII